MATNQFAVGKCTYNRANDRAEKRHQEVRNVSAAGKGDIAPARQLGKDFRTEVTRWVHGKTCQWAHRCANDRNQ
ncbi:hypothetical protein SGP15004_10530 [Shigella flexneri]|nr:hypothetical protein DP20_1847 [Shigella flexneri]SRN43058.1 Uncharacterised protein [Shigella flexneri]GLG07200.1 hypothetical protein SGP12012_07940 [Shigella flexneri]GLG11913.1 hypothetical protein SGP12048_11840 [Shigella flexneri]GLG16387.1 hypothetical protein SGP12049_11970 [Shigella flexneri]